MRSSVEAYDEERDMYKVEFMKCKLVKERNCTYTRIQTPADAVDILIDLGLAEASEEYVYLLCLNCKGRITAVHEVAHGSLSECPMSTKAIFTRALLSGSSSIIVAHNHPSGDPSPSQNDIDVTEKLKKAAMLLDTPVLDHLIIASDKSFYSFKENQMI